MPAKPGNEILPPREKMVRAEPVASSVLLGTVLAKARITPLLALSRTQSVLVNINILLCQLFPSMCLHDIQ